MNAPFMLPVSADKPLCPPGQRSVVGIMVGHVGPQKGKFGVTNQVHIGFEPTDVFQPNGDVFLLDRLFNATVNQKSTLFDFIQQAFNVRMTPQQAAQFDFAKHFLGTPFQVFIEHRQNDDRVFANIAWIKPGVPGQSTVARTPLISFDSRNPDPIMKALINQYWPSIAKKIDNPASVFMQSQAVGVPPATMPTAPQSNLFVQASVVPSATSLTVAQPDYSGMSVPTMSPAYIPGDNPFTDAFDSAFETHKKEDAPAFVQAEASPVKELDFDTDSWISLVNPAMTSETL